VGEYFWVLELEFPVKSFENILQFATFSSLKMKPSKCSTRGFSSLKMILRASQT
jgi:hypothetical protein